MMKSLSVSESYRNKIYTYVLILILCIIINTFVNCFSPLYRMEGNLDPATYYMEGKAWAHGYLPYRDFTDVKGIFLFFIYYIGYIISPDKTWGIFSIYIVFSYICSIFSYKICRDMQLSPFWSLCSTLIFLSIQYHKSVAAWGAQPDLLINAFQMSSLYYFFKLLNSPLPCKSILKSLAISMGVGAGAVFLIKYNVLIAYFAIFVCSLVIMKSKKVKHKDFCLFIYVFLASAVVFLSPFLFYLYSHCLLKDFVHDYFFINLACYTGETGYYSQNGIFSFILAKINFFTSGAAFPAITTIIYAIIRINLENNKLKSYVIFGLICAFFLCSFVGQWGYYFLLFAPITIIPISHVTKKLSDYKLKFSNQMIIVLMLLITCCFIFNKQYSSERGFKRSDDNKAQLKTIDKKLSTIHQPKILYFNLPDLGYGLKACALPACEAWFEIPGYPESFKAQKLSIQAQDADFIVAKDIHKDFLNSYGYYAVPGTDNLWKKTPYKLQINKEPLPIHK